MTDCSSPFRKTRTRNDFALAALLLLAGFCFLLFATRDVAHAQRRRQPAKTGARKSAAMPSKTATPIPDSVMLTVLRAEDERRWDDDLKSFFTNKDVRIRTRAALAAGRIGDENAVEPLTALLQKDEDAGVRAMSAFALGEIESAAGADALTESLSTSKSDEVRARSIEALGKIAAALPKTEEARARSIGEAILSALNAEQERKPRAARSVLLLGLTAALRAKPQNAGATVAKFLSDKDARVRADAANTLARLRAKDGLEKLRTLLASDTDAVVRANAARALGAAEDKAAFDAILTRATTDSDSRVRVSAVRALASLKDARAAAPLLDHASKLFVTYRATKADANAHPAETGELLEIATTLGRLLANKSDEHAVDWLRTFRALEQSSAPEIEVAFARIAPVAYLREKPQSNISDDAMRARLHQNWKLVSSLAQGLGEYAQMTTQMAGSGIISLQADAQIDLRALLNDKETPELGLPDVLRAFAAFKSPDAAEVLRRFLLARDMIVRGTAADLIGELAADETNARALAASLPGALHGEMNDATLSILDALAKQKTVAANDAIKTALDSEDILVRRRAATLLKAGDAGDFLARVSTVKTRNTEADYRRALTRRNWTVRARVLTDKGAFVIEFLPDDAPLTVDNFVQLARRGYFNGVSFHRVVPNFVIQGGDPRGDGNGGPGYQIRCEINEVPYGRGAVGMALSGKDTGGSQWFVTHSPQPHLDGGYTVFGRVTEGMDVVDRIERGDIIRSISVTESARGASKESARAAEEPAQNQGDKKAAGAKKSTRETKRKGTN